MHGTEIIQDKSAITVREKAEISEMHSKMLNQIKCSEMFDREIFTRIASKSKYNTLRINKATSTFKYDTTLANILH